MGLDMYVYARRQLKNKYEAQSRWSDTDEQVSYPKNLAEFEADIFERNFKSHQVISYEQFQIGYFRKFNALHHYIINEFAEGCDQCQDIVLSSRNIDKLLDVLKSVNKDNAEDVMPTSTGCFFGSVDYDEYYFADIEYAIDLFTKAKSMLEKDTKQVWEIIYHASW